jgi:hypothetical protein
MIEIPTVCSAASQAARIDLERAKNEARTYANKVVPEARGRAAQITQSAIALPGPKPIQWRPLLARADISAQTARSGGDPKRSLDHTPCLGSKKPGDETGLFGSADLSAEQAGRIDNACGRQQTKRDQSKLHDLSSDLRLAAYTLIGSASHAN